MTDVRVMVYDAYTALMIPNASVTLFEIMYGTSYSQATDSSGVAYFFNLPSSRYSVSVDKSGYRESNSEIGIGGDYLEVDVPLQPTGGSPPPNPPVVTDLGFYVVDANGVQVSGASVYLAGVGTQLTNSFGRTIFLQVGLFTYSFTVSKSGYNEASGTVDASHVVDQTVTMTLVSQPPPPPIVEHIVTVAVTNQTGTPLTGINVQIAKVDGGYSNAKATGLNGSAVFTRAPTGTYGVTVNNGVMNMVFVDRDLTVTFAITPPPPPPSGWTLTVQVLQEGGTRIPDRCAISIMQGETTVQGKTSEDDGSQVFTGIPTGTYSVKVNLGNVEYVSTSFVVTGNMTKTIFVPQQGGYTVTWEGDIPPFKDGEYKWSLRFNITPIPFLDNYIVDWLSQRPQDEAALNSALASKGITGTVAVTDKTITKHTNVLGNVDQFTITYTFTLAGTGLSLSGQQSLVVWIPILLAALPAILTLLTAIVYLLIINSIVAGIEAVVKPGEFPWLIAGGIGIAGLLLYSEMEKKGKK
jgi:hypothetical protein